MTARRLIVSADDFGMSTGINAGILRAHREGILTSASLMVNGSACAEAVELARAHPTLSVGLHLVLVQGRACAPFAAPSWQASQLRMSCGYVAASPWN